nr:MAG TPA: Protein of unknown function (DUF2577) [Caudoviricetes sp.]
MEGFDGHPGTSKLATVLSQRMKKESDSPLALDFGEIQGNGSLVTNTFPVPIPKGDYSVCRHVGGLSFTISEGGHAGHENQTSTHNTGSHKHTVKPPVIQAGDRVLVAWVQNEAVVIDVITSS